MDAEDESTTYLKYLNDAATTNNYLLSSNVELTDGFPFSEICATDWQSENFPILLNTSMIADNDDNQDVENNVHLLNQEVDEEIILDDVNENLDSIQNGTEVLLYESETNSTTTNDIGGTNKMYFSPILKEDTNGNKEIYLTENEINNDSTVIQLLNTDGSVLFIDKSILTSLNLTEVEPDETTISNKEEFYTSVVAHKCKLCNYLCETDISIKLHLTEQHQELFTKNKVAPKPSGQTSLIKTNQEGNKKYTIYLCSLCKLAFCNKTDLKEHMMNKHNLIASEKEKEINEEQTIKTNTAAPKMSLRSLSSSLIKQQEIARKKIKCTIKGCHVRFSSDELRQKHEQCHIGEKKSQFKCLQCEERFPIWRICCNHMWKIHKLDIGLLSCCMCNVFKSYNAINMLKHMATHDEEKPFLCNDCGKGFKTLSQVKNHEVLHKKELSNAPNWIKTRQCDICHRHFANSKSFKKHMQSVHEKFKPFICNICGHKSARKAMLELHLRQHTGDKPYKCTYCEYRTGDHNCLRKHIMMHKGIKKYKCPYCSYTAIQSSPYKNHIKNRHPDKTAAFHCTYCPFTSINADIYYAHVRRHEISMKENVARDTDVEVSKYNSNYKAEEDDDTQNCIFNTDITVEETVDTGGITIPAGVEL